MKLTTVFIAECEHCGKKIQGLVEADIRNKMAEHKAIPLNGTHSFGVGDDGIQYSEDQGMTWQGDYIVVGICFDENHCPFYILTDGRGNCLLHVSECDVRKVIYVYGEKNA